MAIRQLQGVGGVHVFLLLREAQKLEHIWIDVILRVLKLQQLCINILLLIILWGGGGKLGCLGEKLPPAPSPPVDRTLPLLNELK